MLLQCRHPHRTQPFLPPPAFTFIYKTQYIHNQFIFPHIDMQPLMPNSLSPHPSCRKRFLNSNKKLILTDFFFFFNLFTIRNCRLLVTKYPQDYFTGNYGNTGSLLFSMLLYYQKHFSVQKYITTSANVQ